MEDFLLALAYALWAIGFVALFTAGKLLRRLPRVNVQSSIDEKLIFRRQAWRTTIMSLGSVVCNILYVEFEPSNGPLVINQFLSFFTLGFLVFGFGLFLFSLPECYVALRLQTKS